MELEAKACSESRAIKTTLVLPPDTNNHGTLFGGKLLAHIDEVSSIAALKHARKNVVTASMDSVDFLFPVTLGQTITIEAFVTYAHRTSMEIFVKVVTENVITSEERVCNTAFLTFVALDENGKPDVVPAVYPETEQERALHEAAIERAEQRKARRRRSKEFAEKFGF